MKIATIMVVYWADKSELFEAALESVHSQKLKPEYQHRIYLAVNGPLGRDATKVLSDNREKLHKIVTLPTNRGLGVALNKLIESLDDEQFVFRMDADDLSLPHRYQTQLDFLQDNRDIDILGTDIWEYDDSAPVARIVRFSTRKRSGKLSIIKYVPVAHPTVCFRASFLSTVRGYPEVDMNEDVAMWFKCTRLGGVFDNVPMPLLVFRIDEKFWKRRSFTKAWREFMVYSSGTFQLFGLSWRLVYAVARLCFRLTPTRIKRAVYASSLRH